MSTVDQPRRAAQRIMSIVLLHPASTPAERADRSTSLADARTALCLATGTALEDIHPAAGYDLSWDGYQHARKSWMDSTATTGWDWQIVRDCTRAGAYWARLRPEWVDRLPWPTPGIDPECSAEADRRLYEENAGITDSWRES